MYSHVVHQVGEEGPRGVSICGDVEVPYERVMPY